ncbi:MAG: hypothetical protein ACK5Q4_08145, partial [Phycisphaerae bacterium]
GVGTGDWALGTGVKAGKARQDRGRGGGFGTLVGFGQAVVFRVRGMIGTLYFRKACKRLAHRNRRAWAYFACAKYRGVVHEA